MMIDKALNCSGGKEGHRGNAVKIGGYKVLAGGARNLRSTDLARADYIVTLCDYTPRLEFGRQYAIIGAPLVDFGGVPKKWGKFLTKTIIPIITSNKKILAHCVGGHGRTGTFLASLIALMEPDISDPIKAVRFRYCRRAVETLEQAKAIFALQGKEVPEKYIEEFYFPPVFSKAKGGKNFHLADMQEYLYGYFMPEEQLFKEETIPEQKGANQWRKEKKSIII